LSSMDVLVGNLAFLVVELMILLAKQVRQQFCLLSPKNNGKSLLPCRAGRSVGQISMCYSDGRDDTDNNNQKLQGAS
jgi:hypothetical protein